MILDGQTSQNSQSQQDTNSEFGSEMSADSRKRKRRRKNFIKRNKEVCKFTAISSYESEFQQVPYVKLQDFSYIN